MLAGKCADQHRYGWSAATRRRTVSNIVHTFDRWLPVRWSLHSFCNLETQGLILVMLLNIRFSCVRAVRLQRLSEA